MKLKILCKNCIYEGLCSTSKFKGKVVEVEKHKKGGFTLMEKGQPAMTICDTCGIKISDGLMPTE